MLEPMRPGGPTGAAPAYLIRATASPRADTKESQPDPIHTAVASPNSEKKIT